MPYDQGRNAITVFTAIKSNQEDNNKDNIRSKKEGEIVISIRDRSTGIDPEYRKSYSQYLLPNQKMDSD